MASDGVNAKSREERVNLLLSRLEGVLEESKGNPSLLDDLEPKHLAPLLKCLKLGSDPRVRNCALDLLWAILRREKNADLVWDLVSLSTLRKLNWVVDCWEEAPRGLKILDRVLEVVASSGKSDNFPVGLFRDSGLPYAVASVYTRSADTILSLKCQPNNQKERKQNDYMWGSAAVCLIRIQKLILLSSPESPSPSSVDVLLRSRAYNILKAIVSNGSELKPADRKHLTMCLMYYLSNVLTLKKFSEEFCKQQGHRDIVQLLGTKISDKEVSDSDTDSITDMLMVIRAVVCNGFGRLFFQEGLIFLLVTFLKKFVVFLISQTYDPAVNHSVLICVCEILSGLFCSDKRSLEQFVRIDGVEVLLDFQQSCYPSSFVVQHLLSVIKDERSSSTQVSCPNFFGVKAKKNGDSIGVTTNNGNTNDDNNSSEVELISEPEENTNNDSMNPEVSREVCCPVSSEEIFLESSDEEEEEGWSTEDNLIVTKTQETTVRLGQIGRSFARKCIMDVEVVNLDD